MGTMSPTRVETRARARALQALYAWEMGGDRDLIRVAERVWDDLHVPPEQRAIARRLVRTIASVGPAIDAELTDATTNWRLGRLGAIERAILRLGAAEMLHHDTPPKVVIQELVHLGERFGSLESARFVNGVLDAIARRGGRLPEVRGPRSEVRR